MEEALAQRNLELSKKGTDTKHDDEKDNLLAHLVKHTQGKEFRLNFFFPITHYLFWDALDKNILKDEVISFSKGQNSIWSEILV